jgi:hypothetical protein
MDDEGCIVMMMTCLICVVVVVFLGGIMITCDFLLLYNIVLIFPLMNYRCRLLIRLCLLVSNSLYYFVYISFS